MDFNLRYKADRWGGIAWNVLGYVMEEDEDYEWTGIKHTDYSRVQAHMVGDDRIFIFEPCELSPIKDDEYCPECGQIGCKGAVLQ